LFGLAHFIGCTRPGHRLTGQGLPDGVVQYIAKRGLYLRTG